MIPTPHNAKLIAVDVAKESLVVFDGTKTETITNTSKAVEAFIMRLAAEPETLVACESTGGYERLLLETCWDRKVRIARLHAGRIRQHANSLGMKAKTDPIDAEMILNYAKQNRVEPSRIPSRHEREFVDWLDRRSQLVEMRTQEKCRIDKARGAIVEVIERHVRHLNREIEKAETKLRELARLDGAFAAKAEVLQNTIGVGEILAWTLLAYLPEIGTMSRNEIKAMAGLAPFNRDSGKKRGRRSITGGRAKIRTVLFMAAVCCLRYNPVIRDYVQGLRGRGKAGRCALVAGMAKLLTHLNSEIRRHLEVQKVLAA